MMAIQKKMKEKEVPVNTNLHNRFACCSDWDCLVVFETATSPAALA